MTEEQIQELLSNFEEAFRANLVKALRRCPDVSEEPPFVLGRVLLELTARDFAVHSHYKALLKRLEPFV